MFSTISLLGKQTQKGSWLHAVSAFVRPNYSDITERTMGYFDEIWV
jgi:hypothetical protein